MRRKYLNLHLIVFVLILVSVSDFPLKAENGVKLELIVRQKPALLDKYFEVIRDTVEIPAGGSLFTFLVNMGLDFNVETADTQAVEFTCHLTTVGRNPYNFSNRYRVEYNLPARIENIPGKNNSVYQLLISPRKHIEIDTRSCPYATDSDGPFKSDPAANFDFYYIPNSLADYHWNRIKSYLEADYVRFKNVFDITSTGKFSYFLCPCPVNAVKWDKRFGYALDPGRKRIFTIYSHDYVSSEAILTNMTALLHYWGYAPPFLVEGLGGYFEFLSYHMKKQKDSGNIPEIKSLLTTSGYYRSEPREAELAAASFVKYLTDTFGFSNIRSLYEKSDDLTLPKNIETIYNAPLDSLQTDWLEYVDTVTLNRDLFDFYASRAGALYQTDHQIEYYEEMLHHYDDSRRDSIDTARKLYMLYYQYGHYYAAEEGYRKLVQMDSSRPVYWQIIGNLNVFNGEYDTAWEAFDSAFSIDTTYASARLMQAEILARRGDTTSAIEMAEKYYGIEQAIPAKVEFLLLLGDLYGAAGPNYDSAAAHRSYTDALTWTNEMMSRTPDDPTFFLRAARAHFGLKDYGEAKDLLEMAYFLETRSFYLGQILAELGQVNDILGDREAAVRFYQECLNIQSPIYFRELCRRYIDEPYHN